MNKPKISIIIPVYKTEKYLRGCVESVLSQEYRNIDIILVDDGSPDNSPVLCDELANKNSNITVIHKENGGLSSARNAGLDALSPDTEYVLFLDSDDQLASGTIVGMVELAQREDADVVIPDRYLKIYEETGREELSMHFPETMHYSIPKDFVLNVMMGKGRAWRATAVLYSVKSIQCSKARFPFGRISEDTVFNLILFTKAEKIAIFPQATLRCLKHAGSITASYHSGFEKDIWYIDKLARQYLKEVGEDTPYGNVIVDGMLARNLVAFLFKLFRKSTQLKYQEKKSLATSVINATESREVLRKSKNLPYFESYKTRVVFAIIYMLFEYHLDNLAFWLMSWRA